MASAEGGRCPYVESCSQESSKWSSVTSDAQFNNPVTGTCTRFDKTASND